jgi:hypothetical protein
MHLIHVWIVASAVPPRRTLGRRAKRPLQARKRQAIHKAGHGDRNLKPEMFSGLLPFFTPHAWNSCALRPIFRLSGFFR